MNDQEEERNLGLDLEQGSRKRKKEKKDSVRKQMDKKQRIEEILEQNLDLMPIENSAMILEQTDAQGLQIILNVKSEIMQQETVETSEEFSQKTLSQFTEKSSHQISKEILEKIIAQIPKGKRIRLRKRIFRGVTCKFCYSCCSF